MLKVLSYSSCFKNIFSKQIIKCQYMFSTSYKEVQREFMEPIHSKFQIVSKEKINHDCYIYKFHFDGPKFPLKIGQHFRIIQTLPTKEHPEGQQVMKYYTPITSVKDFQANKIEVLLKIYRPNEDPLYPKGGQLTPYIETLNIGDKLNIEGPFGKFTYVSPGIVEICKNLLAKTKKVYNVKRLFFIAGGTGITPIYQTLQQITSLSSDNTQIILLFCNKTQKDIILKKQLQSLQPRLKLHYMLESPPEGWTGLKGRVNKQVLNNIYPLNDSQTFYLFCGPPPMNIAMNKLFQQNYPQSNYYKI